MPQHLARIIGEKAGMGIGYRQLPQHAHGEKNQYAGDDISKTTLATPGSSPGSALYPLRLTSVSLDYILPPRKPHGAATFTIDGFSAGPGTAEVPGAALRAFPAAGSSSELASVQQTYGTVGKSAPPAVTAKAVSGSALSVTLNPGYGLGKGVDGLPPTQVGGVLTLIGTPPVAALPGIATQRFLAAASAGVGSVVQVDVNGAILSVRIVGQVTTFPTVTAGGGALLVDLSRLQDVLNTSSLAPAQPNQWWLATTGAAVPAGLAGQLPPALTSRA